MSLIFFLSLFSIFAPQKSRCIWCKNPLVDVFLKGKKTVREGVEHRIIQKVKCNFPLKHFTKESFSEKNDLILKLCS